MVHDGAFSHKEILNLEGHQNRITGSKVTAILLIWLILPIGGSLPMKGLRLKPAQQVCFCFKWSLLLLHLYIFRSVSGHLFVTMAIYICHGLVYNITLRELTLSPSHGLPAVQCALQYDVHAVCRTVGSEVHFAVQCAVQSVVHTTE